VVEKGGVSHPKKYSINGWKVVGETETYLIEMNINI